MLLWDEFHYVDFIRVLRKGGNWLPWIWQQHSDHRIVPVKLVMAPLALFTHWNLRHEMYVSVLLAACVVWGLWRLYRLTGARSPLLFAPVAWLVCSLAQYENMLYGLLMSQYFTLVGMVWALVLLFRGTAASIVAAAGCGAVASCSVVNGFLVWPIGLLVLVARGARARHLLLWCTLAALTALVFFHGYTWPSVDPSMALSWSSLAQTLRYFVIVLGAPLAAGSVSFGLAVGLVVLAGATVVLRHGLLVERQAAPGALVLLGMLSSLMVSLGRTTLIPPLESRYVAYSTLTLVGIHLYLCGAAEASALRKSLRAAWLGLLVPGLLAAQIAGFGDAQRWRSARMGDQYLLQTYEQQSDASLARLYFPAKVRHLAHYLDVHRLGPFAEPRELLLLENWRDGVPLAEILPGAEVEQQITCPVGDLQDLAVPFVAYSRPNQGSVRLSLQLDGRPLATRTVAAASVGESQWIGIHLDPPLAGCEGRDLLLRIESPDGVPGSAITVWTYPRYYPGALRQGTRPGVPERSLGLALNGIRYGLINE
jgi:hypothetical protein